MIRKRVSSGSINLQKVEEAIKNELIQDLSWRRNHERKLAIKVYIDKTILVLYIAIFGFCMIGIYIALFV